MSRNLRQITKNFLAAVPGGLESALHVRDFFLPSEKTYHPGKSFHAWLGALNSARVTNIPQRKSVLFFSYLPHWLNISLAMAVALVARRHIVDFIYLPYAGHERPDQLSETKEARMKYWRFMKSVDPRLHFTDLLDKPAIQPSEAMIEAATNQAIFDTRYILKREEIDLDQNPEHLETFTFRYRRNLDCMTRIASLLSEKTYDILITPNGRTIEFGATFTMAQLAGTNVASFEFDVDGIVISHNHPITDMDISKEWSQNFPHQLSVAAKQRVQERMHIRQMPGAENVFDSVQKAPLQKDRNKLKSKLGIRDSRNRVVLICPNTAWDSALLGRDPIFSSLAEWIRWTVSYFSPRTDCQVVIRAHPLESVFGSGQPILSVIREHQSNIPGHISLIGPDEPINTYDLMGICDFGIVYNSTTGLEMALRGIPVVVAGLPHFARKGFTSDVATIEQYQKSIEHFLSMKELPKLPNRQVELAWCYADVLFHIWPKPFPWHLLTFWKDMARWDMAKVLSEAGQSKFGPSFDLLIDPI